MAWTIILIFFFGFIVSVFFKKRMIEKENPKLVTRVKEMKNSKVAYKEIEKKLLSEGYMKKQIRTAYSTMVFNMPLVVFCLFVLVYSIFLKKFVVSKIGEIPFRYSSYILELIILYLLFKDFIKENNKRS